MDNYYYEKYLKYANSKGISLEQVFYNKYLLYKNKYLKLKGSGDKGKKGKSIAVEVDVVEDSDLIKYFKRNVVNIRTLTDTFSRNIEEQKDTVDLDGNLAIHIYMKNKGTDEGVIDFIFPSDAKISQKNKDGDTFLQVAARHPSNDKVVEILWMKGGDKTKDVKNKAGHTLLTLARDLQRRDKDHYTKLVDMLVDLYYGDEESLRDMYAVARERRDVIERSGFDVRRAEAVISSESDSATGTVVKPRILEKADNLKSKFDRTPEYFTLDLPEIMKMVKKGIMYETVFVSNPSINIPMNSNILSVKLGDFSVDPFSDFVKSGINAIGLVANSHRSEYDRILDSGE
jgi:hypothetical protein